MNIVMFGESYKERTYYNAAELGLTNEELLISYDEEYDDNYIDEPDELEDDELYYDSYRRY